MSLWPTEEQMHQDAIRRAERAETTTELYRHLLKKADALAAAADVSFHAASCPCPQCATLKAAIKDYRETCATAIDAAFNMKDLVEAFTKALEKVANKRK